MTKPNKKLTKKKKYDWPPPIAPEDAYVPKQKNPIHSILTALPLLMLFAGLYYYYQGESEQSAGTPIRAQSVNLEGVFTGLSVVQSGGLGRHYLWVVVGEKKRGIRIQPSQAKLLQALERKELISLSIAPTVTGSKVFWAWRVEQGDVVFLEMNDSP